MKTKLIFPTLLLFGALSQAQATCLDAKGRHLLPPVATANQEGVVTIKMSAGRTIQLSGLDPEQDLCNDFLLKTAKECADTIAKAHVAEDREPRFCRRGPKVGRKCVHLECDKP